MGNMFCVPPATENMQTAFVFAKPHANTPAVRKLIAEKFAEVGVTILSEGDLDGPTIDSKMYIDQHYYAIASKATLLQPSELNVPADKFSAQFGEEWSAVVSSGRVLNAKDACTKLGIDTSELNTMWVAAQGAGKVVKLGGGFYCGLLEPEGKPPLYTLNAFFMTMRSKFTAPSASLHYYVVGFEPAKLSWADFRGQVLGPTDPAKAPPSSLRGMLFARWESLGLEAAPNTSDNGIHASASPFEGLAERMNWLSAAPAADPFGQRLLAAGIPEATVKEWSVDPQVPLPGGGKGSLFDQLEDMDLEACLAKATELAACGKA